MPQRPADDKVATSEAGYGRAFGRVDYLEGGKEADWSTSPLASDSMTLFVRSAATGLMQYMYMEGDGRFYWSLAPGEYVIVGYQVERKKFGVSRRTARLAATFSVPRAGQAIYIGDLLIRPNGGRYDVSLLDRYQEALKRVEKRLADGKFEASRGAMRFEPRLGTYSRVVGICAARWALKCEDQYQGVVPVRPEGTASRFPLTESLTPALEWTPAGSPGITYDIAIFESLSFMFGMNGRVDRLRGTLVAYAEGLNEAKYSPQSPLPPGKQFEWTVRLRDGNSVSSWSSTSHSLFALVAWSRGSGRGFGFETPAK